MNKLGYVISDNIIKEKNDFVGYVKDISEADPTKPILYIGYKKAKKVEGYKSILDKKINDKTFWTFKKTESRSDYEIDLEKFYIYILRTPSRNCIRRLENRTQLEKLKELVSLSTTTLRI